MSILEHLKKINIWALGAACLVLGLSLTVGGLKISAFEGQKQAIRVDSSKIIQEIPAPVQAVQPVQSGQGGRVVASKSGKKYHLLNCSGAKTIIEKNRVYFETPAAAEKAGYTPASNCKGLYPSVIPTKP